VTLSQKLQKLFSFRGLESLRENIGRCMHPVNAGRILATVDQGELDRLRERFPYRPGSPRINRFEDANYWVGVNAKRAQDLWLDRTPPLRILDLGCGSGFFLYVCRFFGHEGLGLDTDSNPLFRGTTDLLKVRRVISRIHPKVPLPDVGQTFDLVTAYRVCFHRMGRGDNDEWKEWAPENWKFFIGDVRTRLLKPGGRLLLEFNPRRDGSSFFTPALRACFLSQGARIFRSKALFAADPKQRPRFKQIKPRQLAK
jgi:SAM-dependent methyltransferase